MRKWHRILVVFPLSVAIMLLLQDCHKTCQQRHDCPTDSLYTSTAYNFVVPSRYPKPTLPADNPMTNEGVKLGQYLFFDPILSIDSSTSCSSCHQPNHAFADPRPLSVNAIHATTRRHSPALQNVAWMKNLFWDGRATTLEDQAADALKNELHADWSAILPKLKNNPFYLKQFQHAFATDNPNQDQVAKALSQFMRSIVVGDHSVFYENVIRTNNPLNLPPDADSGYFIFATEKGDCFHCHFSSPLLTTNLFSNNALDSALTSADFRDKGRGEITNATVDMGRFKVPSLINITLTAPYMHDGRFATLRQVIDFYSDSLHYSPTVDPVMTIFPHRGAHLSEAQKGYLMAFLETLTDTSYLSNPAYTDPFRH